MLPGGHTAEMLALVGQLDREKYSPRTYVVASTDRMGAQKAQAAEQVEHGSCIGVVACTTMMRLSIMITLASSRAKGSQQALAPGC